jgi:hypothetical protein
VNTAPRMNQGAIRQHKPRPVGFFVTVNWSASGGPGSQETSYWEVTTVSRRLPEGVAMSGAVPFDGDVDAARAAVRESITAAGWQIQGEIEDVRTWAGMVELSKWDASCTVTREGVTT